MVYVLLTLNSLLMIIMPLLLGIWLVHRYRVSWKLFLIGAAGFVVSQIGHIPLNQFVLDPYVAGLLEPGKTIGRILIVALLYGLSAGLFEEVTRYFFYYFRKSMRGWDEGLMFGAGWGGIEAILLGLLAAMTIINVYIYQNGLLENFMSAEQLVGSAQEIAAVTAQIEELVSSPPWMFLLGAVERVFALIVQMSLSILVLQAFVRRNILWLFAAIGWHTLVDAVAVFGLLQEWDPLLIETTVGLMAMIGGLLIIRYFKPGEAVQAVSESGDQP
ncbi:MAG: YhfC family intramembrane metalloprotease [Candidatus Promineifilaceae bacterium]